MKRLWVVGIIPLIAGICGAYLRGNELVYDFDRETGLPVGNNKITLLLGGLSILLALFFFIYALTQRSKTDKPEKDRRKFFGIIVASALSSIALFAYGGYTLYTCVEVFELTSLIYGLLTVYCAASVLVLGLMRLEKRDNAVYWVFAVVPVFWACYSLILVFRQRISDPIILDYIYLLFAFVCILLFCYAMTGFAYGKQKLKTAVFTGGMGVYFSTIELLAPAIAAKLNPTYSYAFTTFLDRLPLVAFLILMPFALNLMLSFKNQVSEE